MNESENFWSF